MASARRPRYAVNCSILFTELPLLERPAAAKAAGFDAIELWWPFDTPAPGDQEVDQLETAIRDAGVALVALSFAAGDIPGGDRGLVSWPQRSSEFRSNIPVVLGLGERLGCTCFNALYGNRVDGVHPAEQDEMAVENLALAAHAAADVGGTVLVEPISGSERYPLLTAADVVATIIRVEEVAPVDNLGLLADLYHLTVNGDDPYKVIETYAGRIAHVQVADAPGRNEPGTGVIPVRALLAELDESGYDGWVGLEYKPKTETVGGLGWIAPELRGVALPEKES